MLQTFTSEQGLKEMRTIFSHAPAIHAPQSGDGAPVVLLHGSASNSSQWRSMVGCLEGRFKVITPNLSGYGKSVSSAAMADLTLAEIARALLPVIDPEGRPVHLVGHSFGGAVALRFASMFPGKVGSLTLIEPAAFNVIRDKVNQLPFMQAVRSSRVAMAEGDAWNSMRIFIDYWNGVEAWNRTSHGLRQRLAAMAGLVHRDYAALASDPFTDQDAASVVCPTLVVTGDNSPSDMNHIVAALEARIPFLRSEVISATGHMMPLTDPHIIDPMVGEFIAKVEFWWQRSAIAA